MMIWFLALVLTVFAGLALSLVAALPGVGASSASWPTRLCAVYFLLLAAGEAALPFFRNGLDARRAC